MYRESISIFVQQDATIYSFIISCKLLYMSRVIPSPIIRSTLKYNYNIWHWSNRICYRPLKWRSQNGVQTPPRQHTVANKVQPVADVVITVWVCSWWWMWLSSETCRDVCRKCNKTVYIRIPLDNCWYWFTMHGHMNINFMNNISVSTELRQVAQAKLMFWKLYSRKSEGNIEW